MSENKQTVICVKIIGRVQGVWFRGWTVQEARKLGLSGWVRNSSDGSVEALFAGLEDDVNKMIALCHQGSPSSMVLNIEVQTISANTPSFKEGFFINLPTY